MHQQSKQQQQNKSINAIISLGAQFAPAALPAIFAGKKTSLGFVILNGSRPELAINHTVWTLRFLTE